jgi:hypothetical protein
MDSWPAQTAADSACVGRVDLHVDAPRCPFRLECGRYSAFWGVQPHAAAFIGLHLCRTPAYECRTPRPDIDTVTK